MRYPWANTLLLVLVLGEGITGVFGLVSGTSDRAIYLNLHRVTSFAILAPRLSRTAGGKRPPGLRLGEVGD